LELAHADNPKYEANGWEDEDDDDYEHDDLEVGWLEVEELTTAGRWIPCPRVVHKDNDLTTIVADDSAECPDAGEDAITSFFPGVHHGDVPIKTVIAGQRLLPTVTATDTRREARLTAGRMAAMWPTF
jgi:hypothetical protein